MEDQKEKQAQFDELKAQHKRTQEDNARIAQEHRDKMEEMQAQQRRQQQQHEEERQRDRLRREEEIQERQKELTYVMLPLYSGGEFVRMCRVHPDDVPEWKRQHGC
jgi:hypothetical protein